MDESMGAVNDTLRARAGRRLWVGIPGPRLDPSTRAHLEALRPGGIVLFGRNIEDLAQVAALCTELRALLGADLHVAIDQEGGRVVRFLEGVTVFPGNSALGAVARQDLAGAIALARAQGAVSGRELGALGITVNLAPVCDLAVRADNPGVGDRSFGADPTVASALGAALVEGHRLVGVHTTPKHFPGLGGATVDPHEDLPVVSDPVTRRQLEPFVACFAAGAELVMTCHARYPTLDAAQPATLSREVVTTLLRTRLRFAGLAISDALEMGALRRHHTLRAAARAALCAGHDLLCLGTDDPDVQHEIARGVMDGLVEHDEWPSNDALFEARLARLRALRPDPATTTRLETTAAAWIAATRAVDAEIHADGTASPTPPLAALHTLGLMPGSALGSDPGLHTLAAPLDGPTLAACIAFHALEVHDPGALLPLAPALRLALALPVLGRGQPVEDPLRGEPLAVLRAGLASRTQALMPFAWPPAADDLVRIATGAVDADALVIALPPVRFGAAQRDLISQLAQWHEHLVIVSLTDGQDRAALAAARGATVLTAHGFRPVHQHAVVQRLLG